MKEKKGKTSRSIRAMILTLVLIINLIPLIAQAEVTATGYVWICEGQGVAVWNVNLSASKSMSNTIAVQADEGTRYDIVLASGTEENPSAACVSNSAEDMCYRTSSYIKQTSSSNEGMLLWIRVRSGRVCLRIDSTSSTGKTEYLQLYQVAGNPVSLHKAEKGTTCDFVLSDQVNLVSIPLLICGTNGTQIKRILSEEKNNYELYKFSGRKLYCYTYTAGKKTSSASLPYISKIVLDGQTCLAAYVQFIPSSATGRSGEMQTTKGMAVYGVLHLADRRQGTRRDWESADDRSGRGISGVGGKIEESLRNSVMGQNIDWKNTGDNRELDGFTGKTARSADVLYEVGTLIGGQMSGEEPGKQYTFHFEPGEGTGDMTDRILYENQVVQLPDCPFTQPPGKLFRAWSVTIGNAEPVVRTPGDIITATGDLIARALWIPDIQEQDFIVAFQSGTDSNELLALLCPPGDLLTLSACSFAPPAGKRFKEWSVKIGDAEPVAKQPGDFVSVTGPTVITAIWTWDGQTYTVSFDPGDGSGEMASQSFESGETFSLPACDFIAPPGKMFMAWSVEYLGSDPVLLSAGDLRTVVGDTKITALWQDKPQFKSVSLELGGILKLHFQIVYPDRYRSVDDRIVFTVKDNPPIEIGYENGVIADTGRSFACPVNAFQMADPIRAEYYHDGVLVAQTTCTVQQYLKALLSEETNTEETMNLVRATMDYGSYIQPYLAEIHHWKLGENLDHEIMPPCHDGLTAEGNPAEAYSCTWRVRNTAFLDHAQVFLTLNAGTAFHVQIQLKEGVTGKVTGGVNLEGSHASPAEMGDGLWEIHLDDLPATALGKTFIFSFCLDMDGEKETVAQLSLSPLYYVNLVMSKSSNVSERQAMQALYNYAEAAKAFADRTDP